MSSLIDATGGRPHAAQPLLGRPAPGVIAALLCGYLSVGLPLPALPLFIHRELGFGNLVVGLVIGVQFLATVLTRGYAGRTTDALGGKTSALRGAIVCALAGALYLGAAILILPAPIRLAIVVAGRLVAGVGESQLVTGCVSWSIASVGPQRAGVSMSWTGIAMFGALAIGAPIGMALYQEYGLVAVTIACMAAPLTAALVALATTSYAGAQGDRLPFHDVVGRIWREGLGLMLQGVGLSGLTAFGSLYFAAHAWSHAGLIMSAFGIGFIVVRIAFGRLPDEIGGYRVALASLLIEAVGQVMIWQAPNGTMALVGALVTGLGCALVYPALGVEALKRVPPANRGSAMGAFSAFLDVAFGVAGPVAGVVAGHFGYAYVYLFGALAAFIGAALLGPAGARRMHAL